LERGLQASPGGGLAFCRGTGFDPGRGGQSFGGKKANISILGPGDVTAFFSGARGVRGGQAKRGEGKGLLAGGTTQA